MWSLEFAKENFSGDPFTYFILRKLEDGTYEVHASAATVGDAFDARRQLCEEHGTNKFFLRAKRVIVPAVKTFDEDECCDRWQDAYSSGETDFIRPDELDAYNAWAAKKTQSRYGGLQHDRNQPRFN